jgi:methylase of polypeptide subunit release factors
MTESLRVQWCDAAGVEHLAVWRSESAAPPARIVSADDTTRADAAYRLICEGAALVYAGDYHNARQLLQALGRRFDASRRSKSGASADAAQRFHRYRLAQSQRARLLGSLLVPCAPGWRLPLSRAPEVATACAQAWGECDEACVLPLRELLGAIGAQQWREKGVEVPALDARIHPHYGVFSPVRGEYVDLVARAPLPAGARLAFDIGTGSGVLAALLARRGIEHVVATDSEPRALACAQDNLSRLGLAGRVEVVNADLFPPGQADLVVCNPPWLPARAGSSLDRAVYDPDSAMLRGFLAGLVAHLTPNGEGWLILSDLAEQLGLRTREALLADIDAAGLRVLGRLDTAPTHRRVHDADDPLHAARAAETTSLWRLGQG